MRDIGCIMGCTGQNVSRVFRELLLHIYSTDPKLVRNRNLSVAANMNNFMQEAVQATLLDQRVLHLLQPLVPPNHDVAALVWDSHPVAINKPQNHLQSRINYNTKDKEHSLYRIEASTVGGMPLFALPFSSSSSPLSTDESIMSAVLTMEEATGTRGGLLDIVTSVPGIMVFNFFDQGFK